jgi:uncharacterized protein YggT (Ycf19 family)
LYIFWFRIWVADNRDTFFNRYLAPIAQISDKITGFLRPVFMGATQQHIAIISFAFLVVLRGMATSANSEWSILIGYERGVDGNSLLNCIMFSLLSFLTFVFKIYCITVLYTRSLERHGNHATGALLNISQPFTLIKADLRPLVLLITGMVLVTLVDIFGKTDFTYQYPGYTTDCNIDWNNSPVMLNIVKVTLVTLAAWVQVLGVLARAVFFLVILSWIASFSNSRPISNFSRDWISFLLGPLSKRPLMIGTIDLTPIVFSFVVMFAHSILLEIIANSLDKL